MFGVILAVMNCGEADCERLGIAMEFGNGDDSRN
jgi:hypothetical protein